MTTHVKSFAERWLGPITAVSLGAAAVGLTGMNVYSTYRRWNEPPPEPTGSFGEWRSLVASAERRGPANAKVNIVMFTDYECPACRTANPVLRRIQRNHAEQVSLTLMHYPLEGHLAARPAALSAICAAEQGRLWQMDSALVRAQSLAPRALWSIARTSGVVDSAAFARCMESTDAAARLESDMAQGGRVGVIATPTILVNDAIFTGLPPRLDRVVSAMLER